MSKKIKYNTKLKQLRDKEKKDMSNNTRYLGEYVRSPPMRGTVNKN